MNVNEPEKEAISAQEVALRFVGIGEVLQSNIAETAEALQALKQVKPSASFRGRVYKDLVRLHKTGKKQPLH